jgi:DeoR family fructose operon transcriptional repressor
MLASERLIYIIRRLEKYPAVTIRQLSKELEISEATVRRDLDELERQGKLKRQHGGAVLSSIFNSLSQSNDLSVNQRSLLYTEEKKKVCEMAARKIKDGDCIFLDGGSTTVYLLDYIRHKRIHIVTPSIMVMKNMTKLEATVEFIGGTYNPYYEMVFGSKTAEETAKFRYDIALIGAAGIDAFTGECYTVAVETVSYKQIAVKNSDVSLLLVDSSKFVQRGFCYFANSNEYDYVYTDKKPVEYEIENLMSYEEIMNEKE